MGEYMLGSGETIVIYLIIYAVVQIICYIFKFKIQKYSRIFYTLSVVLLSALTFHLEPVKGVYDIYRYFIYIEQYGFGRTYLSYHNMYLTSGTLIWAGLCKLPAALNNKFILPAVVIFLFYFIVGKIIKASNGMVYSNRRVIIIFFYLANAMMGINNIFGALRYTLAYLLVAYAYVLLGYTDKTKKSIAIVMLIIAQMIHASVIVFVILAFFISNRFLGKRVRIIFATWSFWGAFIIRVLLMLPFKICRYYGERLSNYFWKMNDDPRSVAAKTGLLIVLIVITLYVNKVYEHKNKLTERYMTFFDTVLCMVVGSVAIQTLYIRVIGFIGFLSLPLLGMFYSANKRGFKYCVCLIVFLASGLYAYNLLSMSLYFQWI